MKTALPQDSMKGQVVLVTGGTQGIGLAIAQGFAAAGAQVVVCARNAPTTPIDPTDQIQFMAADVRKVDQTTALIAAVQAQYGHLDVLVNNAGGSPYVPADKASPRFSEAIIGLNLLAPLVLSQLANELMQNQSQGGAIVHVTSVSGRRASPGTAAYGAAKAGLINLAKSQAVEWAPKVRVNCVTAGLVRTDKSLQHYGDEEGIARVAATVPMGRMATPDDIANACLFLASPLASYISGTDLVVDGGGQWPAFLVAAQNVNKGEL